MCYTSQAEDLPGGDRRVSPKVPRDFAAWLPSARDAEVIPEPYLLFPLLFPPSLSLTTLHFLIIAQVSEPSPTRAPPLSGPGASGRRDDAYFAANVRRRQALLRTCNSDATRAVAAHVLLHCHDLSEPYTLCPVLELLASVYERQGRIYEASDVVEYAVAVASRELGPVREYLTPPSSPHFSPRVYDAHPSVSFSLIGPHMNAHNARTCIA